MPTEDSLFSRRDIIRLSALLTATGALPFLNARAARAQERQRGLAGGGLDHPDTVERTRHFHAESPCRCSHSVQMSTAARSLSRWSAPA